MAGFGAERIQTTRLLLTTDLLKYGIAYYE